MLLRRLLGDCHDAEHGGVYSAVVRKDALGREGIAEGTCPSTPKHPAILHAIPEGHGMPDVVVVSPGDSRPDRHLDIGGLEFCRNRNRDMGDADNGRGGWGCHGRGRCRGGRRCWYRCIASTTADEQHDTDEEKHDEKQRVSLCVHCKRYLAIIACCHGKPSFLGIASFLGCMEARNTRDDTNAILHPWLKRELSAILKQCPDAPEVVPGGRYWQDWDIYPAAEYLDRFFSPVRVLLIWDNLAGHRTQSLVQ